MADNSPKKKLAASLEAAKKKAVKAVAQGAGTAAKVGAKAADAAKKGANTVASNLQQRRVEQEKKKYSPVFPEDYNAPDYDRPDLIIIKDGDPRKGVPVCEGAIGWFEIQNELEVLCLYKEAVEFSGIAFYPLPACDAAYYVDTFDENRYINIESYLDTIQREQISELQNMAHALGAKECYIEVYEEDHSATSSKAKGSIAFSPKAKTMARGSVSASQDKSAESLRKHSIIHQRIFEGSDTPTQPELNYFKSDRTVLNLIRSRFAGNNGLKEDSVQIDTISSTGITVDRAAKIDAALSGSKLKANGSLENKARDESRRKQIFHIKF